MKSRIALILLVITLLVIVPVYAQEATTEAPAAASATAEAAAPEAYPVAGVPATTETENPVPGATVLVLLVGVGAVGLVGFAAIMRENYKASDE